MVSLLLLLQVESLLSTDNRWRNIVKFYGITQDPKTESYMLVIKQMDTDLRNYLQKYHNQLTWRDRIKITVDIVEALNSIHSENAIHRDLHSGNILNRAKTAKKDYCYIADLGLCRPVNEEIKEGCGYGVIPYMAPEVLRGKEYTQAADIYSFGIIAYEILTGLPPFYDRSHDSSLALAICDGKRPEFNIKIPQLLEDLIKRC